MPNPSFLEHLSPVACGFNRSMQHLISYTGEVDVENEGLSGSRKGYKQLNGHRFICTFDGANLFKRQRKQNLWPQARLSENY
jgi:hypothetical protein